LRARVLLGYLVLFVVFGVALVVAITVMSRTQGQLTLLKDGYLPLVREVGGADAIPLGLQLKAGQSAAAIHAVHRPESEFIGLKRKRLGKASTLVGLMQSSPYAAGEAKDLSLLARQLDTAMEQLAAYEEVHQALVEAVDQGEPAEGFVAELVGLRSQVNVGLKRINSRVELKIIRVVSKTERSQRSSPKVMLSISALAFAIGLLLLVSMNIHLRPIRQLIASAEQLREGKLNERVPSAGRDDIGRLARSFNAMAASLEERDRKLQERSGELESALADLRRSQESSLRNARLATIGQMAAQIAHEVRNPLNALGLNAELLIDEVEAGNADQAKDLIAAIRNEVSRLTDITESYLELGRLPPLRLEPSSLRILVTDLVRFQGEELEQLGVSVQTTIPEGLPDVQIDRSQLRQALLNIVRNAADALSGAGGGVLRLTAVTERGGVRLDVTDEGPGMDAELVSKIFDPFFSTKETGSGLGLPITHQVIAEHGGIIECKSRLGRGTTFSIWLPVAPPTEAVTT